MVISWEEKGEFGEKKTVKMDRWTWLDMYIWENGGVSFGWTTERQYGTVLPKTGHEWAMGQNMLEENTNIVRKFEKTLDICGNFAGELVAPSPEPELNKYILDSQEKWWRNGNGWKILRRDMGMAMAPITSFINQT